MASVSNKVGPLPSEHPDYSIVEIRPHRCLRILHINPMPRTGKLAQDYAAFLDFKRRYPSAGPRSHKVLHKIRRVTPKNSVHEIQKPTLPTINPENNQASAGHDLNNGTTSQKEASSSDEVEGNKTHLSNGRKPHVITASNVSLREQNTNRQPSDGNTATVQPDLPLARSSSDTQSTQSDTQRDGSVIFFIHGVGGSIDVWHGQMEYFKAKGYEIVVPDLIGHGFSHAPRQKDAYKFEEISKDLMAMFDKYCKRRNVVVGHSYGCSFAAVLAKKRAKWVHKLILVSGGSPIPLAPQLGLFSLPTCMLVCCQGVLTKGFKKSAFSKSSEPDIPHESAFSVPSYVLKHVMNGQDWMEGDADYHSLISVPCLIIHGEDDKLVTIQDELEMQEAIYESQLEVIPEASHMVMMEKPDIVNQLIHDFLLTGLQILGSRLPGQNSQSHNEPIGSIGSPTSSRKASVGRVRRTSTSSMRSSKSIPWSSSLVLEGIS